MNSDEEVAAGVQLEPVSKENPLVSEGPSPAPTPLKPRKKTTLRPDSVGMAVALNSHRPLVRKKTGGRGKGGQKKQSPPTFTSPSSTSQLRKGGEEDDGDDNDLKPPASKELAPTPPKSPSLEGGGKDIIDDDTDVDEEELPDSEPPDSGTTRQVVESSTTGTPSVSSASNEAHINEFATTHSLVGFVISNLYTANNVAFALTGDEVYKLFYGWVLLPTCVTALFISFTLKPRRDDLPYLTFISFQYLSFSIGGEILTFAGNKWHNVAEANLLQLLLRCLIWLVLFFVALRVRFRIARLSDADLSIFLSMSVMKGGMIVGIGQLVFLAFSCVNTAAAAMFLSVYLVIITAVAIASRTVPQEERGEGMTYTNLVILRLKAKEKVQGALGVITALVSMYLFSILGVEGAPNQSLFC